MHRLYGFGARTAAIGIVEALALAAAAIAIVAAGRRRRSSSIGALTVAIVGTALAGWVALTLLTSAVEPSRDRSAAARRVSPPQGLRWYGARPTRVLLIAVDGMDWNALDRLVAAGALPAVSRLLADARTYQIDNHGMGLVRPWRLTRSRVSSRTSASTTRTCSTRSVT